MKLAKNNSDVTINIQAVLKGDSNDVVNEIKKALGNTFTAKIGVDTNNITNGINEALKSTKINNVKLGVDGDALVKQLNRITKDAKVNVPVQLSGVKEALKELKELKSLVTSLNKGVNVKVNTKVEQSGAVSVTKGTTTKRSSSTGGNKDEEDGWKSLKAQRAMSIAQMDKAFQEFGKGSKELAQAQREFERISKQSRDFARTTGTQGINSLLKELENHIGANLDNGFVKGTLLSQYRKLERDRDRLDKDLHPDKYARNEAIDKFNKIVAEHKEFDAQLAQEKQKLAEAIKKQREEIEKATNDYKRLKAEKSDNEATRKQKKMYYKNQQDEEVSQQKLANLNAKNHKIYEKKSAKEDLMNMSQDAKASGVFSDEQFDKFKARLEEYRSLINNLNTNFYKKIGKELGITDESHPFFSKMQSMYQAEKARDKSWDSKISTSITEEVEKQAKLKADLAGTNAKIASQAQDEVTHQKSINTALAENTKRAKELEGTEKERLKILEALAKSQSKLNLLQLSQSAKTDKRLDNTKMQNFFDELQNYRNLTGNNRSTFFTDVAREIHIDSRHPYFNAMRQLFQTAQAEERKWKEKPVNVDVKGTEKLDGANQKLASITQQFNKLRAEALKAGNALNQATDPKDVERLRKSFNEAIQALVNYQRATRGLTKGQEGQLVEKLAVGNIKEGTEAYKELVKWIKKAVQEQRTLDVETGKRLPQKSKDTSFAGWLENFNVGSALSNTAYAARGNLNFIQSLGNLVSSLSQVSGVVGSMAKALGGVAIAGLAVYGAINAVTNAFDYLVNTLQQIGQTIYNILKPGIDLYRTRQSAELAIAAAVTGRASENGEKISFDRGMEISTKLMQQVIADAARSAFNPQELIDALRGTLPLAFGKGFNLEQAYELTKGIAAVAKVINLPSNQVLQETRDLFQGSVTSKNSQVAGALGITNEALKEAEAQGKLYEYIMESLQSFTVALDRYSHTLSGALDRMTETYGIAMEKVFQGIAPVVNSLINWVTDNLVGTYIDKNTKEVLTNPEDFYTEYTDEEGNIKRRSKDIDFEPSEYIEKLGKALQQLVIDIAPIIDEVVEFITELTGEDDVISAVSKAITYMIRVTVSLGEIILLVVKSTMKAIEEFETPISIFISVLLLTGKTILHLGSILGYFIEKVTTYVQILVDMVGSYLKMKLLGDSSGANSVMKNSMSRLERLDESYNKIVSFGESINKDAIGTTYEEVFNMSKKARSHYFEDEINRIMDELRGKKTPEGKPVDYSKIIGNALEKANAKAYQEDKRRIQAEIEDIKQALKEYISKLKDLQERNSLSYQQGFKSMDEYFTTKAQLEVDEAQARLDALNKEYELLSSLTPPDESSKYQQERDLIRLDTERNEQLRKLGKTLEAQLDVQKQLNFKNNMVANSPYAGTSSTSIREALDNTSYNYNALQGSALVGSQMDLMQVGCVEAVEKAMSAFSTMGDEAYNEGIRGVDALLDYFRKKGVEIMPYDKNKLSEGDITFMGHGEDDLWHVVMYHDGKWLGNHGSGDEAVTDLHDLDWYEGFYDNVFIAKVSEAGETFKEQIGKALGTTAQPPEATTKGGKEVRDTNLAIIKEQNQAQKSLTDELYNFDEALQSSAVILQRDFEDKLNKATVTYQDDKLADTYRKKNEFDKIKNEVDYASKYLESALKEMQRTGLARNLELQRIEVLGSELVTHYFEDAFTKVVNAFSPSQYLNRLFRKAQEAEQKGFTFETQRIRDEIDKFIDGFDGIFNDWISRASSYFDAKRNIIDANSGLTSFVKEDAKKELDKGQARWNYMMYDAKVKEYDKLIANAKEVGNQDTSRLELLREQAELLREQNRLVGEQKTLWQETMDATNQALEDGLYNFMTDYINTAESIGEAFRNMVVDMLKDLQKFFAKKAITDLMYTITGQQNNEYQAPKMSVANVTATMDTNAITTAEAFTANAVTSLQQPLSAIALKATSATITLDSMLGFIQQIATALTSTATSSAVYSNAGHATGGYISGPGTGTSDSIPAMLSNGEYVIKAEAVKRYGTNFLNAVNSGAFTRMKTSIPRFAEGGYVGDALQDTARGMTDFAKSIGTSVSTTNNMNVALVRNEQEAFEHFMRSPSGQRVLVDFQKGNGRVFARFNS